MDLTLYKAQESVSLGEQIADSGEASVYRLRERSGVLAKLYHAKRLDETRTAKLAAIVAHPPADPSLGGYHRAYAWAADALCDATGRVVGLAIPEVEGARSLTALGSPKLRRRRAAEINWHYLHGVAANLAFTIDQLHRHGIVVGDLTADNVLVDDRALVTLIDCDSWQIPDPRPGADRPFSCPVGSPGFTAPELIGKPFARTGRAPASDRFALAVLIFQLLTGRHPFTGTWVGGGEPPGQDALIREGDWPHRHGSRLLPPKGALPLAALHPDIEALFRRAFDTGQDRPNERPSGAEWQEALCTALAALEPCPDRPHHYHLPDQGPCPWCRRLAETGSDAFPEPETPPNPFWPLALAFERALARGDARMALELWRETPALADRPALARYADRMAEIGEALDAFDRWTAMYERGLKKDAVDWTALARLWEATPALADRRLIAGETIAGRDAETVVAQALERALAIPLTPPERLLVTPAEAVEAGAVRRAAAPEARTLGADARDREDDAAGLDIPPMPTSLADPARRRPVAPVTPETPQAAPALTIAYAIDGGWAGLRPATLTVWSKKAERGANRPALVLIDEETGEILAQLPAGRATREAASVAFDAPEERRQLALKPAVPDAAAHLSIDHPPVRHRRLGRPARGGFGPRRAALTP